MFIIGRPSDLARIVASSWQRTDHPQLWEFRIRNPKQHRRQSQSSNYEIVVRVPRIFALGDNCPVSLVEQYLDRTRHERRAECLFTYAGDPTKNLSDERVGNLIKESLREAGIDVQRYTAHSLKHAMVTTLRDHKVSWETVQRLARTRSDTLRGWYDHPGPADRRFSLELDAFLRAVEYRERNDFPAEYFAVLRLDAPNQ